jgi:WD40 repeat protein
VSPDDRLLAAAMTDGVAVWDLASGRALTFLACGSCWSVLFEPQPSGGLLTAEAAGVFRRPIDGDAAATGILRFGAPQKLPLPGELGQIAMSGDGRVVAKSIYSGGVVWRPARTEPPISLHFHEDARYIAVSPDGRHVATGSHSDAGVVIWDALTGKLVQTLPAMSARAAKVEFSSNGRWLAASDGGLWETVSWTLARRFDPCFGIAFSPDSKILAMKDHLGVASLVDPETGRVYARLEDPHADRAECLCFSPSGKQLIATRTDSSTVQMWDLRVIREELARIGLDWDLPPYR